MDSVRPSPEELLKRMEEQETQLARGRLKIFFGYAAGVGKTYAMLKAAHMAKQQDIDVMAGYIEPHTRPKTMKLLDGLEKLEPLKIVHKQIDLREFDLDKALERNPHLILVDELAHTNAEGCRHKKRYQDIEELLKAGIDVYTTVNVQHIESLNDIVASITGVEVRERIPDKVFDQADQVELVDIEPEELITRLNEGEIYRQTQAQRALSHFFSQDNLIALREIALRRTADRVNKISERAKHRADAEYYTEEHILVCLSSAPSNAKIIRTAARMADAFKANFTALFVETTSFSSISKENKDRLRNNLKLAEQLGAKIKTVSGENIAFQIAEFARYSGVSKIVVGRGVTKRKFFFSKPTILERLTALAPNLDIYIIPDKFPGIYKPQRIKFNAKGFTLMDFVKSGLLLLSTTIIGLLFQEAGFSEANIITIYILGVLLTAILTTGRAYSLISSVLSVLIFNFFFTEPRYTLEAYDSGYPITFFVMFLSAFLTGTLAGKIKLQAKQSAQMAYRTSVLLETNQLLQQAKNREEIISALAKQLIKLLGKTIIIYLVQNNKLSEPEVYPSSNMGEDTKNYTSDNERAIAEWVFKNNKHAGATTNTLGNAKCLYLAVRGTNEVSTVIGIALNQDVPDTFETNLVLSILGECGLALEKDLFHRKKEEAAAQAKNEQLRANLLRSISHDLRTPLTCISGNAGVLMGNAGVIGEEKRAQLYTDIYDDSMWLINLVENLLSVTRIEDGTMTIHMEAELVDEVITEALLHINRKRLEHKITVRETEEFILAKMDARLIVQVIINIVDNAIKYTSAGSEIIISTRKVNDLVYVDIADNGTGVSDEAKEKLFDMFFTSNNTVADSRRGMGLGLALCKSIIAAHGGEIAVYDNEPHGAVFRFSLQAKEVALHE